MKTTSDRNLDCPLLMVRIFLSRVERAHVALKRFMILLLTATVMASCSEMTEYSPNQIFDNDSPLSINDKNLQKLTGAHADEDTVTIAFVGDSQRFYDEVELFVNKVNQLKTVDFTVVAGDISDFGLLAEFEWVIKRLDKLDKPYVGVIGNHDIVANGEEIFKRSFGALNFSFVYDSIKFVLHNTNSREYRGNNVPDLDWLKVELKPSAGVRHVIGISHVPPFSGDFNKSLENNYAELLRNTPGFLLSLHGHVHMHSDAYPYEDGVRYITTPHFEQRQFILIQIHRGIVHKTLVNY